MHIGGNTMEITTEADRDNVTECTHDDKPSEIPNTGMFGFL